MHKDKEPTAYPRPYSCADCRYLPWSYCQCDGNARSWWPFIHPQAIDNLRDTEGTMMLSLAIMYGHYPIVALLLNTETPWNRRTLGQAIGRLGVVLPHRSDDPCLLVITERRFEKAMSNLKLAEIILKHRLYESAHPRYLKKRRIHSFQDIASE